MRLKLAVAVCLILVAVGVALLPALSQQEGPPFNGQAGQGGPGMGGPGGMMGRGPGQQGGAQAAMVVADGVVYVAAEGKVFAFEAKTLKKLAEVTYSTRPQRGPGGPPGGPGGGQPPLPGAEAYKRSFRPD